MRTEIIGGATLVCGCCEEAMADMTENQFELAICDPPYGIGVNHNMGRRKNNKNSSNKPVIWDSRPPTEQYFDNLFMVTKNQIVWGANHFISLMPKDSSCWLMWDKMFSGDVTFAQFELAWTSFLTTCKKYDKSPCSPGRIHPTQKPVNLYKWLLKNYAKEGDHILDTHGGSMSSVIACLDMGFKITCYEIDEDYFDAGVNRVREHVKQLRLF